MEDKPKEETEKKPEAETAKAPAEDKAPAADKPAAAAKPAGDKPAAAAKAAPKAAPKAAAKAKPAAKPKDPLVDNGDGTITDPNTGYMWKQSDAWLDMHKFYTFAQAQEYLDKLNKEKFAGYEDWRMPNKAEAATLVEKGKECLDKNGTMFPLDPIFTAGRVCNTWITECTEEKVIRFDYKIGGEMIYPPAEVWSSIYAVRGEAKPKEDAKSAAAAAKPAPKAAEGDKPEAAAKPTPAASTKAD